MVSMDCKAHMQVMEWKTDSRHARLPFECIALLLQGGGALRVLAAEHGYYDTVRTLRHSEVLQRPQNLEGVLTFDLGQNGRE
jgi:hypothetical protein